MNTTSVITPVIKHTIHGFLVLWEDTSRVSLYEAFTMASDEIDMPNAVYSAVRFESL